MAQKRCSKWALKTLAKSTKKKKKKKTTKVILFPCKIYDKHEVLENNKKAPKKHEKVPRKLLKKIY